MTGRMSSGSRNVSISFFCLFVFKPSFIWGGGRAKEGGHNLGLPTLL